MGKKKLDRRKLAHKIFELANGDREAWLILIQLVDCKEGIELVQKLDYLQINGNKINVLWNDWAVENAQFFGKILDDFIAGNRDLNDLVILDESEDYYNNYRQEAVKFEDGNSEIDLKKGSM